MRGAKKYVGHAAGEQCHPGTRFAYRRQDFWQPATTAARRRQHRRQLPQPRRQQMESTPLATKCPFAVPNVPAATARHLIWIRKCAEQNPALKPIRPTFFLVSLLHADAERLDQPAVLNSRGTRCFASAAIQAQFQMAVALRTKVPSGCRSRHASNKCDRADRRFRRLVRHRSGKWRCKGRNARNRETYGNRPPRRDSLTPVQEYLGRCAVLSLLFLPSFHSPAYTNRPRLSRSFGSNCRLICSIIPIASPIVPHQHW